MLYLNQRKGVMQTMCATDGDKIKKIMLDNGIKQFYVDETDDVILRKPSYKITIAIDEAEALVNILKGVNENGK